MTASMTATQASAIYISIHGLVEMDGPTVHSAMSALHGVLRRTVVLTELAPSTRVLSCMTGALVIVPDSAHVEVTRLFGRIAPAVASAGIAVRVGLAHGAIAFVEDADGSHNVAGECVNTAARLALATENGGLLVDRSYAAHARGALKSTHWLHPSIAKPISIPGKRAERFECISAPFEANEILNEWVHAGSPWVVEGRRGPSDRRSLEDA